MRLSFAVVKVPSDVPDDLEQVTEFNDESRLLWLLSVDIARLEIGVECEKLEIPVFFEIF